MFISIKSKTFGGGNACIGMQSVQLCKQLVTYSLPIPKRDCRRVALCVLLHLFYSQFQGSKRNQACMHTSGISTAVMTQIEFYKLAIFIYYCPKVYNNRLKIFEADWKLCVMDSILWNKNSFLFWKYCCFLRFSYPTIYDTTSSIQERNEEGREQAEP